MSIAKDTFHQFSQSTSLHGYSYLFISSSTVAKFIWVTVILALSSVGITFLVINTKEFMSSKLVTTIESSTDPLDVRIVLKYVLLEIKHCAGDPSSYSGAAKEDNS